MGFGGLFLIIICSLIFGGVAEYHVDDQIGILPGQPNITSRQFSGYIEVDPAAGRSLFYYFVEAENDPMNQPLTIWLTGGPGCSSVGDSFVGVGPFITTNNARGLKENPYSWTKVSNVLFIDTPIGSGWSYSNTSSDYQTGDYSTSNDLLAFILKWFEKYPTFKSRDLYLSGLSYGGHFVPNFANSLLQYNNRSKSFKFNIKGLALGNPVLRLKLDILAEFDLYALKGMIPNALHQEILKKCNGIDENNYFNNGTQWSALCQTAINTTEMLAFGVNTTEEVKKRQFDVLRTSCDGKLEDLNLGKEVFKIVDEVDMCVPFRADFYFSISEVQKAFHGNQTNLGYAYKGCFPQSGLNYNKDDKNNDMLPILKQIIQQHVPITIFSGEEDGTIPTIGTLKHIKKLASDMNLNLTKNEAWSHENKEGGWLYSFGDLLTLMTIKGGNHHVPLSKPSEALFIFKNHVINRSQ